MAWTDMFTRKPKPLEPKAPNSENPTPSREQNVRPTPEMLGSGLAAKAGEAMKTRKSRLDADIDKASQ
jgi:hypothetical protein